MALKFKMPRGGALCDSIVCRISAVRRKGKADAARNLPLYLDVFENGQNPPDVSVRVFRGVIRKMGIFRKGKVGTNRREVEALYR